MKKIKMLLAVLVSVFLGVIGLTSCTESYDFYEDWHTAGADITEDHIFTVITVDEAEEKIKNNETFFLVVSSSQYKACYYEIGYLNSTAKLLGWDTDDDGNKIANHTVYFIEATDILSSASARKDVRDRLGIKNVNAPNESSGYSNRELVLVIYKDGKVFLDTSNLDDQKMENFMKLDSFTKSPYESLAAYMYIEFSAELDK